METLTLTTPSASTGTPAAAPAISAPSPSITPSQRPTFAQAFASDAASSSATPSPTEPAATAPEGTADAAGATHPSPEAQGPIPFEVHHTALQNARAKERATAQAEWDAQYGWAKTMDRTQLEAYSRDAQEFLREPVTFLDRFVAQLEADPTHAAALRSWAAKTLGSRRGLQPAAEPQPDVEIVSADGQVTGRTFSADGLAKRDAWLQQRILADVMTQVGPLKADHDQRVAQEQAAKLDQQVQVKTDVLLEEIQEIVGDDSLLPEVGQLLVEHPDWSAHKAALHVRKTKVAPAAAAKAQAQVLDSLKTKAGAQGINPASAVVASTSRPKSFHDPTLKW